MHENHRQARAFLALTTWRLSSTRAEEATFTRAVLGGLSIYQH